MFCSTSEVYGNEGVDGRKIHCGDKMFPANPYGASKAAVIGVTKSVAADFIASGIRCNAICPGTVDSPSLHERLRATGDYDSALKQFIARQPMGRLGKCEEIAALATYLASDDAKFITGQAFVIDGGWAA